ncbi:MAG TPA: hypothetical protein VEC97_00900 [Candidatus Acidoferrales bacterium]|nr:hypothetical protein [Candidatus Acidoferrales bacterium]
MYTVLIRVDETLPWIELKGHYETRKEARHAGEEAIRKIAVMVVNVPQEKRPLNALAVMKAGR